MKIAQSVAILAIIGTIGVSSCSKKSDDVAPSPTQTTTTPTTTPGTTTQSASGFRVKIDGKDYAPDFTYALAVDPGKDNYYAVYGLDSKTSDVVVLALPYSVGEGTYPINNINVGMMSFNNSTEEYSTVNGGSGTVTITKKSLTNVVGTFSFTAYDASGTKKRILTEGSFNVLVR